jgi:hypothetical protein
MSLINYFFIGFIFTLGIDLLLSLKSVKNHPKMKDYNWGWNERTICILLWPISLTIFSVSFLKTYFK